MGKISKCRRGDAVSCGNEKLLLVSFGRSHWLCFPKESRGRAGAKAGPRGWKAEGNRLRSRAGSACPVARGSGVCDSPLLLFLLQECTNIFSKGGGEELAKHAGVPFLGEWPLEAELPVVGGDVRVAFEQGDAVSRGQAGWTLVPVGPWYLVRGGVWFLRCLSAIQTARSWVSGPVGAEEVVFSSLL